jgi:hypothetical protein
MSHVKADTNTEPYDIYSIGACHPLLPVPPLNPISGKSHVDAEYLKNTVLKMYRTGEVGVGGMGGCERGGDGGGGGVNESAA